MHQKVCVETEMGAEGLQWEDEGSVKRGNNKAYRLNPYGTGIANLMVGLRACLHLEEK